MAPQDIPYRHPEALAALFDAILSRAGDTQSTIFLPTGTSQARAFVKRFVRYCHRAGRRHHHISLRPIGADGVS